jgi:hypothetical protein
MRWPWVSAARLDDLLREKNSEIGRLEKRIADLEHERKRIYDLIFKQQFGVQVHDTLNAPDIPDASKSAEPERPLTPDQQLEAEMRAQEEADRQRVEHAKRYQPSQLSAVLADIRARERRRAVEMANPGQHPARQIFAEAKAAVNGNGHKTSTADSLDQPD